MQMTTTTYRSIAGVVIATGLILLIPLVTMQISDDVNWNLFDFAAMGTLLFGTGLMFVLAASKIRNIERRAVLGIAIAAALLLVWAELAVGIFGSPVAGS